MFSSQPFLVDETSIKKLKTQVLNNVFVLLAVLKQNKNKKNEKTFT